MSLRKCTRYLIFLKNYCPDIELSDMSVSIQTPTTHHTIIFVRDLPDSVIWLEVARAVY